MTIAIGTRMPNTVMAARPHQLSNQERMGNSFRRERTSAKAQFLSCLPPLLIAPTALALLNDLLRLLAASAASERLKSCRNNPVQQGTPEAVLSD